MSVKAMDAWWNTQREARHQADLDAEAAAEPLFRRLLQENKQALMPIAHWSDGHCGYLLQVMQQELGLVPPPWTPPLKAKIGRKLAKQVFERDAYRCVRCGGYIDLCCDHRIPESKCGATTFENLQTMCQPCNRKKRVSCD